MTTAADRDLVRLAAAPCPTDARLRAWVEFFTGLHVPTSPVCPHHDAPFAYVSAAYREPAADLVVWAPRGGGKTRLAAVVTLLDLLHKPGCAVRILGGSLGQSLRMWEHLLPDLERTGPHLIERRLSPSRTELTNRSTVAVLAQSQTSVRGQRVQKLRCDEVDEFDADVWEAAQLVTRQLARPRRAGDDDAAPRLLAAGSVEAISTFHKASGMMSRVVESARQGGRRVIRWCILDVLERCPPERDCNTCPLWDDCRGVAKTRCDGFYAIDDAIRAKTRVSLDTWQSEMLCRRPSTRHGVFPTFDRETHVVKVVPGASMPAGEERYDADAMTLALDFGFAAPFVCLWIVDHGEVVHVVDEYVREQRTVEAHLTEIESRRWGRVRRVSCDPAGAGRNEQTARSNVDLLRSRGYRVTHRASRIADGLELIRAALRPAAGPPRLFIHPRCERLVEAMRAYHYAPGGGETPEKDGPDHACDALRYFFVNRRMGEVTVRSY